MGSHSEIIDQLPCPELEFGIRLTHRAGVSLGIIRDLESTLPSGFGIAKFQRLLAERYALKYHEHERDYLRTLATLQQLQKIEDEGEVSARSNGLFQTTLGCSGKNTR